MPALGSGSGGTTACSAPATVSSGRGPPKQAGQRALRRGRRPGARPGFSTATGDARHGRGPVRALHPARLPAAGAPEGAGRAGAPRRRQALFDTYRRGLDDALRGAGRGRPVGRQEDAQAGRGLLRPGDRPTTTALRGRLPDDRRTADGADGPHRAARARTPRPARRPAYARLGGRRAGSQPLDDAPRRRWPGPAGVARDDPSPGVDPVRLAELVARRRVSRRWSRTRPRAPHRQGAWSLVSLPTPSRPRSPRRPGWTGPRSPGRCGRPVGRSCGVTAGAVRDELGRGGLRCAPCRRQPAAAAESPGEAGPIAGAGATPPDPPDVLEGEPSTWATIWSSSLALEHRSVPAQAGRGVRAAGRDQEAEIALRGAEAPEAAGRIGPVCLRAERRGAESAVAPRLRRDRARSRTPACARSLVISIDAMGGDHGPPVVVAGRAPCAAKGG